MPGVPRHLDIQRIKEDLLKLEDVQSVDELNVWALTADKTAALVHLQLSEYLHNISPANNGGMYFFHLSCMVFIDLL